MNKKLKYPLKWDEKVAKRVANGCGAAGAKWKSWIIPNKILFVSVKEACRIHDFMYHIGRTKNDKKVADKVFLQNMYKIFEGQPWYSRPFNGARRKLADQYYNAVSYFGESAFMSGKDGINDTVEPTREQLESPELKKFAGKFINFKVAQATKQKKDEELKLAAMKKFNRNKVA